MYEFTCPFELVNEPQALCDRLSDVADVTLELENEMIRCTFGKRWIFLRYDDERLYRNLTVCNKTDQRDIPHLEKIQHILHACGCLPATYSLEEEVDFLRSQSPVSDFVQQLARLAESHIIKEREAAEQYKGQFKDDKILQERQLASSACFLLNEFFVEQRRKSVV